LAFPNKEKTERTGDEEPSSTEREYTVEVSGRRYDVRVIGSPAATGQLASSGATAPQPAVRTAPRRARAASRDHGHGHGHANGAGDALASPLQGTIFKVAVLLRQAVQEGELICVIEAMKMENEITAHKAGVVVELNAAVGAAVSIGDTLAVIASE
ncbi:MAG: carbamoyl phosphate synthase, partial [Acidobacteriota bacterium]|nr:carbamoyl phosphate synthase [Acidobacteriota bacterium]